MLLLLTVYYDARLLAPNIEAVHLFAFDQKTPEYNPKEADFPAPIYGSYGRVPEDNIDVSARQVRRPAPTHTHTWVLMLLTLNFACHTLRYTIRDTDELYNFCNIPNRSSANDGEPIGRYQEWNSRTCSQLDRIVFKVNLKSRRIFLFPHPIARRALMKYWPWQLESEEPGFRDSARLLRRAKNNVALFPPGIGWNTALPAARLSSVSRRTLARGNWRPTARFPACRPSRPTARALQDLTPISQDCCPTPRCALSWPSTQQVGSDASATRPRNTAATLIRDTTPTLVRRASGQVTKTRTRPATRPRSSRRRDSAASRSWTCPWTISEVSAPATNTRSYEEPSTSCRGPDGRDRRAFLRVSFPSPAGLASSIFTRETAVFFPAAIVFARIVATSARMDHRALFLKEIERWELLTRELFRGIL